MKKAKIFDCNKASSYKPTHPKTVLIRLLDSYHQKLDRYPNFIIYPEIKNSSDFHTIIEIYCDDVDATKWRDKEAFEKMCKVEDIEPFDSTMAKELLDRLQEVKFNKDEFDLVVHCRAGVSRSSATFLALNEIYRLGYENLKEQFEYYNRSIYEEILQVGQKV